MGRCTLYACLALSCECPHLHVSAHGFVSQHDTSHHSPWLCAPPSPSSVSVRLLSILAPLRCSSAAERCHRSSYRQLSPRSTHCDTATEIAGKQRGKSASQVLFTPLRSLLLVGCTKRERRRERRIFFLCRSSS